ncbi:MAG: DUF1073 domain-containing protein [Candidatus Adiutrix sp.]|jgi:phage-related protein (TIGR01555 family)|nr:DUF1073 domain-containing protein [Candidatus Adiutrix sp.]
MRRNKSKRPRGGISSPPGPKRSFSWPFAAGGAAAPIPTLDDLRAKFGPARTLGASEEIRLAADSALESSGAYSLMQHASQMGLGYGPGCGGQFLGYAALSALAQDGLVSACVETVADDLTRAWIELNRAGDEHIDDTEAEALTALEGDLKKFRLQEVFHRAASLTGWFGGCLIFIDTGAFGDALREPLNLDGVSAEMRPGALKGFRVVEPVNCFPGVYNCTDPLAPDYFKPRSWWVLSREVHASRFIHMAGNDPPLLLKPAYNFFGIPHAQILYDYIQHFQECRQATQRLLTKFSLTALKTDMQTAMAGGGTADLDERSRYFVRTRNNDGLMVIDNETEDLIKLETPLSGVTDIARQSLEFVAAVNRTPAVKLLGISPAGFNATGESDLRNYYDHIESRQEKLFRAGLDKVLNIIQLNRFGRIDPVINYEFRPLSEADESAVMTTQKLKADIDAVLLDRGVLSPEEVRQRIASDPDSGHNGIDPAELPPNPGADFPSPDDEDRAGAVYGGLSGLGGIV